MNDRPSVETSADTVEEAVAKGLAELGVSASDVIVEVLEEPSRGVFGIGARPAKVRLQLFRRPMPPPPPAPPPTPSVAAPPKAAPTEPRPEVRRYEPPREADRPPRRSPFDRKGQGARPDAKPRGDRDADRRPKQNQRDRDRDHKRKPAENEENFDYSEDFDAYAFGEIHDEATSPDSDTGREILNELLTYMGVRAQVRVTRAASHQPNDNPPYLLNIEGPRTDVLVGRRGDTLAALQYITRLIASRKLGRRANIVIDVEGYKARRSQKLRELATRMAEQALRDQRTVVLEPMPPHERRIIHMTLRSHPEVSTKSVGEGDARKVTIIPK